MLADDSVLLREGIASLLEGKGFEIVGQSGTAEDLLLKVRSYSPDIAIVDIKMPPTQTDEGLRAAKEIREQHPDTAVLVLSQYVEEGYALELLQDSAEGVGYLLKDRVYDLADFVAAVRRVAGGGSALDPSVVSQLVGRRRRDDPIGDSDRSRARGARADGRGAVELRDRRARLPDRARRREARHEHLPEAAPPGRRRYPPAGARGRRLPAVLAGPSGNGVVSHTKDASEPHFRPAVGVRA